MRGWGGGGGGDVVAGHTSYVVGYVYCRELLFFSNCVKIDDGKIYYLNEISRYGFDYIVVVFFC